MWGIYLGISSASIHGHLLGNQAYEAFNDFPTFWEFADGGEARYIDHDDKGASIYDVLKVFRFLPPPCPHFHATSLSLSAFSRNLAFMASLHFSAFPLTPSPLSMEIINGKTPGAKLLLLLILVKSKL